MHDRELSADQLIHRCPPEELGFKTTADVEDLGEALGQARATEAIALSIGIRREGYHLYAMGPAGSGKHSILRRHLEEQAASEPTPTDWCYVHDFARGEKPVALALPAGRARTLAESMRRLVDDLRAGIPAAFETDEYRHQIRQLEAEFNERQEHAFLALANRAKEKGVAVVRTSNGLALAPAKEDGIIEPDAFRALPEKERKRLDKLMEKYKAQLEKLLHTIPKWRREVQHKIREVNRKFTRMAVNSLIDELKKEYSDQEAVVDYLTRVQADVIANAEAFRQAKEGEQPTILGLPLAAPDAAEASLARYKVNVLIDRGDSQGAPIVYEDNPTYDNLIGRIDHYARMGALVTDFTQIKPGALHRANGGYLILDILKVLQQPLAWEGLKRALRSRRVNLEPAGRWLGLITSAALDPEPIPLDVKVVLVGERLFYYLLHQLDPDLAELFKVVADFAEDMPRDMETTRMYARLIATLVRKAELRPFDSAAVARVIEHSSRLCGDAHKLCLQMRTIMDLLMEADYAAQGKQVEAADVQRAIEAQEHRSDRVRERLHEEILRATLLIDCDGEAVGQINALSVFQLGSHAFASPTRVTARVRMGSGKVVDIEREVKLGGPLHSKGVLILAGFLEGRYLCDMPLSLAASLVFEQSYGGVEGDSASSAELYALLSALAEVPIRQSLAVTGSVNQHGRVQAIGGVNEKIEGFFDVCRGRGLTGDQGVLIPASNVKHLMLRHDVVEAVDSGRFHVYAAETIDQGIEILTGVSAGERSKRGKYPARSLNGLVEQRLTRFAEKARDFAGKRRGR